MINPKWELWRTLKTQIFLGSEDFIFRHQLKLNNPQDLSEVSLAQRSGPVKRIASFASEYADKKEAMARAYLTGHYLMKEIGQYFGLHYSTVSRAVHRFEQERR